MGDRKNLFRDSLANSVSRKNEIVPVVPLKAERAPVPGAGFSPEAVPGNSVEMKHTYQNRDPLSTFGSRVRLMLAELLPNLESNPYSRTEAAKENNGCRAGASAGPKLISVEPKRTRCLTATAKCTLPRRIGQADHCEVQRMHIIRRREVPTFNTGRFSGSCRIEEFNRLQVDP
jgi:hypothetical protein